MASMDKAAGLSPRALRRWTLVTGFVVAAAAVLLARLGNPPNMGICSACFQRDTAGGLGFFSGPAPLQYLRPEIPGFLLGAFIAALLFGEFRSRGGSSPLIRFVIGAFVMIGALVFLGCPLRMLERIAGGDWLTGGVGLLGLLAGVGLGSFFISRGYTLGPVQSQKPAAALAVPLAATGLMVFILYLMTVEGADPRGFLQTKFAAPVLVSHCVAGVVGFFSQRTGYCSVGGYRDALLWRDYRLLNAYVVFFVTLVAGNILVDLVFPGGHKLFDLGAAPMAHSVHLWSFLGMVLVGLGAVLAGGCPFRQLIAAGQGNSDAALTLAGLLAGAAFCHNFGLAAQPAAADAAGGPGTAGKAAVVLGIVLLIGVGLFCRDRKRG
jgi:YedE family putative selenium metabolism protein